MRTSLIQNNTADSKNLDANSIALHSQVSVESTPETISTIATNPSDVVVVLGSSPETQPCIAVLPKIKISAATRRQRKRARRKLFRKKRRVKKVAQRLRKKNIPFFSKYSVYCYFLPRKPLLPGAKKKEILTRAKKTWAHKITIKISSNNIFCTLADNSLQGSRVLETASAGQYKIKITKKRVKRQYKLFLRKFFAKIWPKLGFGGLMVFITAPIRLRKKIVSLLLKLRTYRLKSKKRCGRRAIFIKILRKKCFNGCQSSKRRRKKRKVIRLTK